MNEGKKIAASGDKQRRIHGMRLLVLVSLGIPLVIIAAINSYIARSAGPQVFSQASDLAKRPVGIVLGTDLTHSDGSTNIHFLHRVEGAANAFLAGKVDRLVISGNPNNKGYNEVLGIKGELLKRGVPEKDIILDFNGVRTLDSIRKIRDVFRFKTVTIITDDFHAPRALFLCRHYQIDAVAFCNGKEPISYWFFRSRIREYFARVKAVWDICL